MKFLTRKNMIITTVLITFGVVGRMVLLPYPNVETLTVVSILAGALLGPYVGFTVGLVAVVGSDMMIGNELILIYTWSAWAIIGAGSTLLKRRNKSIITVWTETLRYTVGGVVTGLFFYVWTNFGVWHIGGLYQHTWAGLLQSYINGLPFLKMQLLSNLLIVPAVSLVTLTAWKYAPMIVKMFTTMKAGRVLTKNN